MKNALPQIYVIAGPNGSGKTTSAKTLLPELLNCNEYVNADYIAAALSPFSFMASITSQKSGNFAFSLESKD